MHGRQLAAGDVIAASDVPTGPAISGRQLGLDQRPAYSDHSLSTIVGPHIKRLGSEGRRAFFGSVFKVSRDADRMGYRLEGPLLDASVDELLSFGLVAGAGAVPPRGPAILLLADHGTAGGYPVVSTVSGAGMPVAERLLASD